VDRTYSTNGRDEKCIQNLSENLKRRDNLGNLGINLRIIILVK
jgi:hypothetical protein